MARKARAKKKDTPNRVAQTAVTPFVGLGDVLLLVNAEHWVDAGYVPKYRALLYAALAALAACARVRVAASLQFTLADYLADVLETKNKRGPHRYPVVLLPAAIAAIEDYLAYRRELGIGGTLLFVKEDGKALSAGVVQLAYTRFSRRCGHPGGKVIDRLVKFHDRQLERESRRPKGRRDEAACIALRRGYRGGSLDNHVRRADVTAAAADRDRLKAVLSRNHDLAGPKGRSIGGHGLAKARETARVFSAPRNGPALSPAVHTDETCLKVMKRNWLGNKYKVRRDIVRDDFPHLYRLLTDELITVSDLTYLMNCDRDTVKYHLRRHRARLESEEDRQARLQRDAEWRDRVIALYQSRPPGEELTAFFARIEPVTDHYKQWGRMIGVLKRAGLLPRQVARQRKKRLSE